MPPFDFSNAIASGTAEVPHLADLFVRMTLATVLGGCVAYRFWRRFMPFTLKPPLQGAQAQTLIAAAGALMVVVIGDNVARAFGLVGLGSFIRFRSGISDPRDAAVMFVMIGIGMACGLGLPLMATGAALFVATILILFDLSSRWRAKRTTVTINAEDPPDVWTRLLTIFPRARLLDLAKRSVELGKDSGKLVVEVDLPGNMDAAAIRDLLLRHEVPGVIRVGVAD